MAITSELLGKLGGADVESVPVSGTSAGSSSSEITIHTVQVPAGEIWLITVVGTLDAGYERNSIAPEIYLGTQMLPGYRESGALSMAIVAEGEEDVEFRLKRRTTIREDSFTGHVHIIKM